MREENQTTDEILEDLKKTQGPGDAPLIASVLSEVPEALYEDMKKLALEGLLLAEKYGYLAMEAATNKVNKYMQTEHKERIDALMKERLKQLVKKSEGILESDLGKKE